MRFIFTSTKVSSGGSAVQVSTDSMSRVIAFTFTSRANNLPMFIGNSSTLSSANGFTVSSRGFFPPSGEMFTMPTEHGKPKGFAPSSFWINASADTTDRLDGVMLVEP